VKKAIGPVIYKWRQTEPELILCAVRWYLRYSLSFRDVEKLLTERGLDADHTTIWRWVQRYGPELEQRLRRHLKPTNKSWRVDETYVRVNHLLDLCITDFARRTRSRLVVKPFQPGS
jgi:transposase, IS6 family